MVTKRLPDIFASGRSVAAAQFDDTLETLTVNGVKCATVTQVQRTHIGLRSQWESQDDFINDLQKLIQFWGLSDWYVTGETDSCSYRGANGMTYEQK